MPIVCVGLSHRTAPVDVRERHAFPASRMGEALVALRDYPAVTRSGDAADLRPFGNLCRAGRLRSRRRPDQVVSHEFRTRRHRVRYRIVPVHAARAPSRRSSLARRHRTRLDADRRSRDPRASQRCVRAGAAREIAWEDPPPALPRRAQRRQDGARADADRSGVGFDRDRRRRSGEGPVRFARRERRSS